MRQRIAAAMIAGMMVSGCANMTTTEQRTLSGAAIGALGGGAVAAIAETSVATGIAIGAGAGAAAGYLYSVSRHEQRAAYRPTSKSQPAKSQTAGTQSTRTTKASKPAPAARAPVDDRIASSD